MSGVTLTPAAASIASGDYAWLRHPGLMSRVIEVAAQMTGVRVAEIVGPRRDRETAHLRFAVMLALHRRGVSLSAMGRRFDRDHTSVMHAVARAREIAAGNPAYAEFVDALEVVPVEPVTLRHTSF